MKLINLQEAQYAGSFSVKEIHDLYGKLADDLYSRHKVEDTKTFITKLGKSAVLNILIRSDSNDEAKRRVRGFLKTRSLPYTEIKISQLDNWIRNNIFDEDKIFVQVIYQP